MQTSEQIKELATALSKAQGEMKNAALNKTNPHFKSQYADWASIRDATVPALSANGLSITQFTRVADGSLVLTTRLIHSSGQWMEGEYPLPMVMEKPQVMGSALSYAKRYSWAAVCGIAAAEDDDANAAASVASTRRHGPDEPVIGALGKMALQEKLRKFDADLKECTDEDMLWGLLNTANDILEQCRTDLPSWWQTKEGSDALGFADRIRNKKAELQEAAPAYKGE